MWAPTLSNFSALYNSCSSRNKTQKNKRKKKREREKKNPKPNFTARASLNTRARGQKASTSRFKSCSDRCWVMIRRPDVTHVHGASRPPQMCFLAPDAAPGCCHSAQRVQRLPTVQRSDGHTTAGACTCARLHSAPSHAHNPACAREKSPAGRAESRLSLGREPAPPGQRAGSSWCSSALPDPGSGPRRSSSALNIPLILLRVSHPAALRRVWRLNPPKLPLETLHVCGVKGGRGASVCLLSSG